MLHFSQTVYYHSEVFEFAVISGAKKQKRNIINGNIGLGAEKNKQQL